MYVYVYVNRALMYIPRGSKDVLFSASSGMDTWRAFQSNMKVRLTQARDPSNTKRIRMLFHSLRQRAEIRPSSRLILPKGAPNGAATTGAALKGAAMKGTAPKGATKGTAPKGSTLKGGAQKGSAPKGTTQKGGAQKGGAPKGIALKVMAQKGTALKGIAQKGDAWKGGIAKGSASKGGAKDGKGGAGLSLRLPVGAVRLKRFKVQGSRLIVNIIICTDIFLISITSLSISSPHCIALD